MFDSFIFKLLNFLTIYQPHFARAIYARMGSTGGGRSFGGGHFSGGSSSGSFSNSSHSSPGSGGSISISWLALLGPWLIYSSIGFGTLPYRLIKEAVLALIIIIIMFIKRYFGGDKIAVKNLLHNPAALLITYVCAFISPLIMIAILSNSEYINWWLDLLLNRGKTSASSFGQYSLLTRQNIAVDTFEQKLKLKPCSLPKNADQLIDTYEQAEYLYGSTIRQFLAGDTEARQLKKYLATDFYQTMKDEIKLKAAAQTLDDVTISTCRVIEAYQIKDLTMLKLEATGVDNEYQANSNFDTSFKQEKWQDYVVYNKIGKIVNIIYGEHFHLNGTDFNQSSASTNQNYKERNLTDHEHDLFKNK